MTDAAEDLDCLDVEDALFFLTAPPWRCFLFVGDGRLEGLLQINRPPFVRVGDDVFFSSPWLDIFLIACWGAPVVALPG